MHIAVALANLLAELEDDWTFEYRVEPTRVWIETMRLPEGRRGSGRGTQLLRRIKHLADADAIGWALMVELSDAQTPTAQRQLTWFARHGF